MRIQDLHKDTLHHAYLVSGRTGEQCDELQQSLALLFDIDFVGNPDVLMQHTDAYTVADARAAVGFAARSAIVAGADKVIVLTFSTITREAQNILLKTLEEPAKNTYIFILTPSVGMLLPTVLSRCMRAELDGSENGQRGSLTMSDSGKEFVDAGVPERIKIIEKINKGKDKAENKAHFLTILSGLEAHLHTHKPQSVQREPLDTWQQGVGAVLQAQEYMRDRGAMSKMLMESVALVV